MTPAPFRQVAFGAIDVERTRSADGAWLLRSRVPLGPYARVLTERLLFWAEHRGDRAFLARRGGPSPSEGSWNVVTYADALRRVERLAQALLDRELSAERPVAILSENGIEHGLLTLAAMHVGVPVAPISPAYSLLSGDFGKLRHILGVLTPGLVVVSEGTAFERALTACVPRDVEVVVTGTPTAQRKATSFADLASAAVTPSVERAHRAIDPDRVAKILFTSGSTGAPKGVINTHRMLCSNLRQITQCFPCIAEEPLTLLDWLPWHHTFGGNHNVGLVLDNGGTLYIDDGKPTAAGIATTVANLREISPTVYFNVPKGFTELLPHLEADEELRRRFFSRLRLLFYAGAGLAQPVWDALERLAVATIGARVVITSGLGCTEAGPSALFAHRAETWSGLLGVPVPGLELKLAPVGDKLEARYRGPNITPGYFRAPDLTARAFDAEGFYRTGDAVRFVDPADVNRGMLFDGRIAEDFKLTTGTWVSVGALRGAIVDACAPWIVDAVVTGIDRDYAGAILFPSVPACAEVAGMPVDAPPGDVVAHAEVRRRVAAALSTLTSRATGSSNRLVRAVIATAAPSMDAGEVTDKGSLNQRAVLDHRATLVESLYADPPGANVIVLAKG